MKRAMTVSLLLFLCYSLSGQTGNQKTAVLNQKRSAGLRESHSVLSTIWSDDFSNSSNWTITTPFGSGSYKDWMIGTTAPSGTFAIPAILSTTAFNGFALFDSDKNCSGDQIADITTSSPVNCSADPFVSLNFQQQYNRFLDSTFVFVSNNGTTWTKYPVNVGAPSDFGSSVNPEQI